MELAIFSRRTSVRATLRRQSLPPCAKFGEGGPSEWAKGDVFTRLTCAQVYWRWISFLLVLVVLAFLFYPCLIVQGPKGEMLWKPSSVAVLFCSLDQKILENASGDLIRDEIYQVARYKARLLKSDDGRANFSCSIISK